MKKPRYKAKLNFQNEKGKRLWEKRIIKPEEFAYLKDVVCVFPNGYKRLQKANYYEDKTFTDRM